MGSRVCIFFSRMTLAHPAFYQLPKQSKRVDCRWPPVGGGVVGCGSGGVQIEKEGASSYISFNYTSTAKTTKPFSTTFLSFGRTILRLSTNTIILHTRLIFFIQYFQLHYWKHFPLSWYHQTKVYFHSSEVKPKCFVLINSYFSELWWSQVLKICLSYLYQKYTFWVEESNTALVRTLPAPFAISWKITQLLEDKGWSKWGSCGFPSTSWKNKRVKASHYCFQKKLFHSIAELQNLLCVQDK